MQPRRPHGQRRAVDLDHHVADLAGADRARATACRRARCRRRRRCPRRRRAASRRLGRRRARPRRRWPPARRCRGARACRAPRRASSPSGKVPSQPGRLRALGDGRRRPRRPRRASRRRRRPARRSRRPPPAAASRSAAAIAAATSAGPPSVGVGWRDCAEHLAVVVHDDGLDLGAAQVDAAAHAQAFGAQAYAGRATNCGPDHRLAVRGGGGGVGVDADVAHAVVLVRPALMPPDGGLQAGIAVHAQRIVRRPNQAALSLSRSSITPVSRSAIGFVGESAASLG